MDIAQRRWTAEKGWGETSPKEVKNPDLVLLFGGTDLLSDHKWFDEVRAWYPKAHIVSASTAGEIFGTEVTDNTLVVTAIKFGKTRVAFSEVVIERKDGQCEELGRRLAEALPKKDLAYAMILSDGLRVNGTK